MNALPILSTLNLDISIFYTVTLTKTCMYLIGMAFYSICMVRTILKV